MNFWKNLLWFSLTNAIVFYLAFMFFGYYVVFGNALASIVQAVVVSSILVGLAVSLVGQWGQDKKFSDNVWMLIYWGVNTATIYILARTPISKLVGIGIRAFWVAIILGFVVNFAQYGVWKTLGDKK